MFPYLPDSSSLSGFASSIATGTFNNTLLSAETNPGAAHPKLAQVLDPSSRVQQVFVAKLALPDNLLELVTDFTFAFGSPPVPQAVENADPTANFNLVHNSVWQQVELTLRKVIDESLTRLAGSSWIKHRVAHDVSERWAAKQDKERKAGRPVYGLIHYSDVMDMHDIIVRNDNWTAVFQELFRNKDDIAVSLRRLYSVRNAMSHSRPLCNKEVLTLFSEAARILGACEVRFLN